MTEQFPGHAFAWSVLGICLAQMGRFGEAVAPMSQAASLQPANAGLHNNLGNILNNLGRVAEAEASFRRVLALQPDSIQALFGLGNILIDSGRSSEAEACFRHVLALAPDNAQALNNLGNALTGLGRHSEAEACYRSAVARRPDMALAHHNLGSSLKKLDRLRDAEASLRRALALEPDFVDARFLLGNVLTDLGRLGEAEACFRRVVKLRPDDAEAYNGLGTVLENLDRPSEAEPCFRRVLELKPGDARALNNLASALNSLGRLNEAETCYRAAVALKPDYAFAYGNLGGTLTAMGRLVEAEDCLRRAVALKPDYTEARSNLLLSLNYRNDAADVAIREAREYGQSVDSLVSRRYSDWLCEPSPKRLRVGIVSGDLCQHVVSYFLENLLREIDPARVELIAYPAQPKEDQVSQRLRAHLAAWRPIVGLTDEEAAKRIHADGVHILLDLSGHTGHNRLPLFAWKPAPVQASWLGYFATTGVTTMDYLIADPWALPESEEAYFTEKIWRLPETRLCFSPPAADVPVSPLPARTSGYITFGCFNNLTKVNDGVVALWSRVLTAVPDSRLFLKSRQLKEDAARQGIAERFASHGIGADRLILEGPVPRAEYLAAYARMDIALDPFPFPGGTTSAEALWMGVPVLTLAGDHFLSRQGVGIMANTGLPDWIASDPDDYVARAVAHAADLSGLAALRASLRERFVNSPICDARRFARNFEEALDGMWRARGA